MRPAAMATAQSGNRTLRIPTEGCSRGKGQLAHIKHFENKLVSIVIKRLIKVLCCHWRELPQVSFLLQQTPVATKHIFCCDKIIFVTIYTQRRILSQQMCVCRYKIMFVATKLILVTVPANDTGQQNPPLEKHKQK